MDNALHSALTNPDSVLAKIETEWRLLAMKVHERLQEMTDDQKLNYYEEWTTWMSMPKEAPDYKFMKEDNALKLGEDDDDDDGDDNAEPPPSPRRATLPAPPKSAKKQKASPNPSAIPKRLKPTNERTPLKQRTRTGRKPWKP